MLDVLSALSPEREKSAGSSVRVNLLGRYMLADRREFPCQGVNVSPGGMAVNGVAGEAFVRLPIAIRRLFSRSSVVQFASRR